MPEPAALPQYRPERSPSGSFVAPPVAREFCETLLERWQSEAQRIENAAVTLAEQGAAPETVANLRNVAGANRRCARELSAVVRGLGPPPSGSLWVEAMEE